MYFHPGFAVRNAWTCLQLARGGAHASASILEGEAGFFQAYARAQLHEDIALFADGRAEIERVFNKPAPACNFAQSPCQAALRAVRLAGARRIEAVRIDTTRSEEHTSELQSLMRISYAVFCLKKKITK